VAEYPPSAVEALPEAALTAESALPTGRDARDEDPVACLEAPHSAANLFDGPYRLMAEDPTGCDLGEVTLEDMQVAAADCGRVNCDDGVGGIDQCRVWYFVPTLLVGPVVDECS
jgi:hypothetical protein